MDFIQDTDATVDLSAAYNINYFHSMEKGKFHITFENDSFGEYGEINFLRAKKIKRHCSQ